jgi:hypothetical protein
MSSPNTSTFSLSLVPELEALGLGEHVHQLEASQPVSAKRLQAFRLGLAEGTSSSMMSVIESGEGHSRLQDPLREHTAYNIGLEAVTLLEQREIGRIV